MAARDSDTAFWLQNKLGSTDDLWSSSSICSQLTREKLLNIQECFHTLNPPVKLKLLLSFLHLPKRNSEEWRIELEEILQIALEDSDPWVATCGDVLRNFPSTGCLNHQLDSSTKFFHEAISELRKLVKKHSDNVTMPMESAYLGKAALQSVCGLAPQPVKHFALKRKPKSAALRAEILQKSVNVSGGKKSGVTVPIKMRSFAKKMDDSTPMRGLPNHVPAAGGFLKSNSINRFAGNSQRSIPRKEGGVKLLDISEMPVGAKEAKRRKKQAEAEEKEQAKKAEKKTTDYTANIAAAPTVQNMQAVTSTAPGPSYLPSRPVQTSAISATSLPLPVSSSSVTIAKTVATTSLPPNTRFVTLAQLGSTKIQALPPGVKAVVVGGTNPALRGLTAISTSTVVGQATVTTAVAPQQTPNQSQKKGLSLTKEQMVEAQEMFLISNKVTRPEKALILGFMAGSRENPCPQQGDIVNIRLSEDHESIHQQDGTFLPMIVDTFFQMNYSNGIWRKIKKYRPNPE